MRGTYLYAILAGEVPHALEPIGLPDGAGDVATVAAEGLAAVVSRYDGPPFSDLMRADVLDRLVIHQRVIEGVMGSRSVLPAKFGTVLPSPAAVHAVLGHFRARFAAALAEVEDAVEVNLSATIDLRAAFAEIVQEVEDAAPARTDASEVPGEAPGERLRIGMLVRQALERRRDGYRRRVVSDLVPFAYDAQPSPLPSEEVVCNVAFLVGRDQVDRFDAAVARLADAYADRLAFRYVGPLPPYSFAMVELARPDPREIESARKALGLGVRISEAALRAGYRQLATQSHPDRNPTGCGGQRGFTQLTAAYGVLAGYIHRQRSDVDQPDGDRQYDLAPETVAETALLEIVRADTQCGPPSGADYESVAVG
jgi:hypothetical protein